MSYIFASYENHKLITKQRKQQCTHFQLELETYITLKIRDVDNEQLLFLLVIALNFVRPLSSQHACRVCMGRTACSTAAVLQARPATMSPESAVVLLDSRETAANRVSATGTQTPTAFQSVCTIMKRCLLCKSCTNGL